MISKAFYQQGLSLIELMVAMLLGLFLTLGSFSLFSMSATNVTATSQLNQLQESGRIALALMEPELSQAGFFADITGIELIPDTNTQLLAAEPSSDCVGEGINNATLPNNSGAHFRYLWGFQQGSGIVLDCLNNVLDGTDVIQLKRLIGPSVINPNESNRYYMATTANEAVVFTGNQPTPVLDNARFWEYQHHIYYIRNDDEGIPVLRRKTLTANGLTNDEQLVEGVEDMQILYGFDTDQDGAANVFRPSQTITDSMWDNQLNQRLVAMRVFLLIRAIKADPKYTNNISYTLGDKQLAAFDDNFRRKLMSTTIVLENPMLIRN